MMLRTLGRTGIEVSEIGLGTEFLNEKTEDTVVSVIQKAIDHGINYYDVLFSFEAYRKNMGAALRGRRDDLVIAGHVGCAETKGQYRNTRNIEECRKLFEDLLRKLDTDHVDVLILQLVDEMDDYERIIGPGGLLELAKKIRKKGQARTIGLSGHEVETARRAASSGEFDVLMFPVNMSWDGRPGRKELFQLCMREGIGLVAMKPFMGGQLLSGKDATTPTKALSYVLRQEGVSTVVPGVKNLEELDGALAYLSAGEEEKDFTDLLPTFRQELDGSCVYCNHCLPCPAAIDIGATLRLLNSADGKATAALSDQYRLLPAAASACTECGSCMKRCPFGVDVISGMRKASGLFE